MRRILILAGLVLIAASAVLGVILTRRAQARAVADAQALLAQLGTGESAPALLRLSSAPFRTRRAFLDRALSSDATAQVILRHPHALSVALSRVDFADARRLYDQVLRGQLLEARSSDAVEASTVLLARWNLAGEISPADAASMVTRMAQRIEAVAKEGSPGRYAPAMAVLADRLTAESADTLMAKLYAVAVSAAPQNAYDAVQALIAVAPKASSNRRRDLAVTLAQRLSEATDRQPVVVLGPMLVPLAAGAGTNEAGEIASRIVARILTEFDANQIQVLLPPLRAAAAQVSPQEGEREGRLILGHIEFEMQPAVLFSLTQALKAFGDRVPVEMYRSAADSLLQRIRVETKETSLTMITAALGLLNHAATLEQFTEAANRIVGRFADAQDMMANAALASAIDAVADELKPPVAEKLSTLLVARLLAEPRIGPQLYIAVGLASMADEVATPGANELSGRLLARLRGASDPNAMRTLAFSIAAFTHATANWNEAAAVLASRLAGQQDPDDLRKLASGLYALRGKADATYFDQAAAAIAGDIETSIRTDRIAELVPILEALSGKAGPEPFERAAAAIVANAAQVVALQPSLGRIAPKVRAEKARELVRALAERFAAEQDPGRLRALGASVADFPQVHADIDVSGAMSRLMLLPDAPCELGSPDRTLLDPLCSEASWDAAAAKVLRMKMTVADRVEPDFAQLADDDDDDAPSANGDEPPVPDFRRLSDFLSREGTRTPVSDESATPWIAIVLAAGGAVSLVIGLARRS